MEFYNLLKNRMTGDPAHHAVIELADKGGGWHYGFHIRLKKSFAKKPMPDGGDGEISREIALIFALGDIINATPCSADDDLDEYAIADALRDEARRELAKSAEGVPLTNRTAILKDERLRVRLSYVVPKNMEHFLNLDELYKFDLSHKGSAEQLSLF